MKCIRCQYGLCHDITGNINGATDDIYNCMEILVSDPEKYFHYGTHGQFIVILSRTRIMKNTIFFLQIMKQFVD